MDHVQTISISVRGFELLFSTPTFICKTCLRSQHRLLWATTGLSSYLHLETWSDQVRKPQGQANIRDRCRREPSLGNSALWEVMLNHKAVRGRLEFKHIIRMLPQATWRLYSGLRMVRSRRACLIQTLRTRAILKIGWDWWSWREDLCCEAGMDHVPKILQAICTSKGHICAWGRSIAYLGDVCQLPLTRDVYHECNLMRMPLKQKYRYHSMHTYLLWLHPYPECQSLEIVDFARPSLKVISSVHMLITPPHNFHMCALCWVLNEIFRLWVRECWSGAVGKVNLGQGFENYL